MASRTEIVFGINPVQEKLRASPKDVLEILFAEAGDGAALRSIEREAVRHGVRVSRVPVHVLDRLASGQRHQGVIAKIEAFHYLSLDKFLERISSGCDRKNRGVSLSLAR